MSQLLLSECCSYFLSSGYCLQCGKPAEGVLTDCEDRADSEQLENAIGNRWHEQKMERVKVLNNKE